jgi:hypothetical protein
MGLQGCSSGASHDFPVRPNGTGLRRLIEGAWSNAQPAFSADGTRLYTYRHLETADYKHGSIAVTELGAE